MTVSRTYFSKFEKNNLIKKTESPQTIQMIERAHYEVHKNR